MQHRGFKALNDDLTCHGYQYEIGKTHVYEGEIEIHKSGFHYCLQPIDVVTYYPWIINHNIRIFEIEAGQSMRLADTSVTDTIKLIREIPRDKMFKLCTGIFIDDEGKYWLKDNLLHRNNGPALIKNNGSVYWYKYGKLHNEHGPAIISKNAKEWYINGLRHRINGPAIVYKSGTQYWYMHGVKHCDDGPAIIAKDGSQYWYKYGKLHREKEPAIIDSDGSLYWYECGKLQRSKVRDGCCFIC